MAIPGTVPQTGTPIVTKSQVFPSHSIARISISSSLVSRGLIRVTDQCLEVTTADVIILRNGNISRSATFSHAVGRKLSPVLRD